MTISKGQLIDLSSPKVMGILNITQTHFTMEGKFTNESEILAQVDKMLAEGATFIDVGAYSSKPHAEFVSENSEIGRIVPIVQLILKHYPNAIVSIDTFRVCTSSIRARCCYDQ
jgi:dihydropteroate synthase